MGDLLKLFMSLSNKVKMIIIGIIIFVILLIVSSVSAEKQKEEKIRKEQEAKAKAAAAAAAAAGNSDEIDMEAILQASYVKKYGEAPEGFKWTATGELQALSDNTITAEDTAYYFMRGLSTLDFSVAEKYSATSLVVDTYNGFYNSISSMNYYTQFLRKMYKQTLLSMEINEVLDSAVFADGSRVITFSIDLLDLTDKDFWRADADKIYADLYTFEKTEADGIKADQYIYDYTLAYYTSEVAKKRTVQVDLRIEKQKDGGWLVVDDNDLNMICSYEYGVNITDYIKKCFDEWKIQYDLGQASVSLNSVNTQNTQSMDKTREETKEEQDFSGLPSNSNETETNVEVVEE